MPALPRAIWLAIGALAAALLGPGGTFDLPLPPALLLVGAAAGLAGAISLLRRGRPAAAVLGIGTATVMIRASLAAVMATSVAATPLPAETGTWEGTVLDVSSPSGMDQRAMLRLHAPAAPASSWVVYAWLPRHPALLPSDRVRVRGQLEAPPLDAAGFAEFLASRGAAGTLNARGLELVGSGSGFFAAVEQLRWGVDDLLARAVPEPESGLAAGILVGLRERVSRGVADDFTVTGLTHVVAISGWNIALVAAIVTALLRGMGLGRRARSLIVVVAIVAYTILAGAEASVVRAAVMGGVVIAARESGRPSGATSALGLACWGLLLVDPGMIDDIGLQLSLAATAGLLVLGKPAETIVLRVTRGAAPAWFCESLGVSLAAQLATLPLILVHFGRLSVISPLANLLVAPVVPFAMLGAAVGVLLGPVVGAVPGVLLAPLLVAAWLPLALMTRGASVLAEVPLASIDLLSPLDLAGAAVALGALLAALRAVRARASVDHAATVIPVQRSDERPRRMPRWAAPASGFVLVSTVTVVLVAQPVPALRMSVLDVGQGDAILLETSNGQRLLVDGGPDPDLLVARLDERIPAWDRHIDLVILTHPHEDHAGGLAGLMPRYTVGRIAETGIPTDGSGVRELRAAAQRHGVGRSRLVQGDSVAFGDARVSVLWPPASAIPDVLPSTGRGINDTSIVLAVGLGRQRALLTGDLEEDRDHDLLDALPRDAGRWDVLKVAHHGSATATSMPLLEALRPRLAVVSSGAGNSYGHPARALLERLDTVGAHIRRTDLHGTVALAFDGRPRAAAAMLRGPRDPSACPAAMPGRPPHGAEGSDPCYARPDGRSDTSRSARLAAVHLAVLGPASAHDGRGRGGLLPRLSHRPERRACRSTPRGDCRAPPRRGQGLAAGPSTAHPPAW